MISAPEALARLREGNARFVSDVRGGDPIANRARRLALTSGQEPFAIVLGCADSRVPAEMVFDQGLGDLFVIRVAGNIVASSQIDSVEFAAARFGTRLVVVLGHSQCGAVIATLEELQQPRDQRSRNLRAIVGRIQPSVEALLATDLRDDPVRAARAGRSREHPRVGQPSAPRIGSSRAPDRVRRPGDRRRGVFTGHWRRMLLRRIARSRVTRGLVQRRNHRRESFQAECQWRAHLRTDR